MLISLLGIILRRSSIVAAAAKCSMFRKRTRLKWFMGIQTDATQRSMNPYSSPNFLHIFTTLMQDCYESIAAQGKKSGSYIPLQRLKHFPLCRFPMSGSATLLWSHPDFCCVVWGWHHANSSAEKVCSRRLKAGILCLLFTLFMLELIAVLLPKFNF